MRAPMDPKAAATAVSDYGWVSVRAAPEGLFGVRNDAPGVWRLLPDGARQLVTDRISPDRPEDWAIHQGRVFSLKRTRKGEGDVFVTPLAGGASRLIGHITRVSEEPGLAVDLKTGQPVFPRIVTEDSDIGLMTLERGG